MTRYYSLGESVAFDALKGVIFEGDQSIKLGGRESMILQLLCQRANAVMLKEDINIQVWGAIMVSETSLTKAISNLRKALSQFENITCEIKTVPKEGYVLIADEVNGSKDSFDFAVKKVTSDIHSDNKYFFCKTKSTQKKSYLNPLIVAVSTLITSFLITFIVYG